MKNSSKKLEERVCKKVAYKTRSSAWKRAIYYFTYLASSTGAYKCRFCGKFHLSRQVTFQLPKKLNKRYE